MAPALLSSAAPGDATTGTEPTSGQASTRTDGKTKNGVEIKRGGRGRAAAAGGWAITDGTGLGCRRRAKAKRQSSTTSERKGAERELPEGLRAEVLAAVQTEELRRKAWTRAERAQALQDDLGPAPGRVHRAACSGLSRQDMRLAGLSKSECDEAMSMRKGAMALTAAAEYIAVPKGRLDRWERSGLAKCSFTRKIAMAKMVTARFWTKRDADWIKGRTPMLEAHDAARRKRAGCEGKGRSREQHNHIETNALAEVRGRRNMRAPDEANSVLGYAPQAQTRSWRGTPIPPVDRPVPMTPLRAQIADRVWCNGPPWTILRNRSMYLQHVMEEASLNEQEAELAAIDRADWQRALRELTPGGMSWRCVAWWSLELGLREYGSICEWPLGAHPKDMLVMRNLSREELMTRHAREHERRSHANQR